MDYENLTVEQYQKLQSIECDNDLDKRIIQYSIITGKTISQVEDINPIEIFKLTNFLQKPVHAMPFNPRYGRFKAITDISEITAAQHKDFTTFIKQHDNDYVKCLPHILAIIHKEITLSGYKYVQEHHFRNVEVFKKAKLKDVLGTVFFYSKCFKSYSQTLKDCLESNEKKIAEMMMTISEDSEFQTFLKDGGGITQSV